MKEDNERLNNDIKTYETENKRLKSLLSEKDGGMARAEDERSNALIEKQKEITSLKEIDLE